LADCVCQTCDSTKIITKSAAMRPQENMHNGLVNNLRERFISFPQIAYCQACLYSVAVF
jgi:hypothetical protein